MAPATKKKTAKSAKKTVKKTATNRAPSQKTLDRYRIFALTYISNGRNATEAYRAISPKASDKTCGCEGNKYLEKPEIQKIIEENTKETLNELDVQAKHIVQKLWNIANVDMNDLVELREVCCRHCYGQENKWQYTAGEWDRIMDNWAAEVWKAKNKNAEIPAKPDEKGGIGFHKLKKPNPECPECFGEGLVDIKFKPTADMPPEALEIYAGVKTTRDGMQLLTLEKMKAIELLGKWLKMWTDRRELSVPEDDPLTDLIKSIAGNTLRPQGG